MCLGLNVDRGRVMRVVITAMEAYLAQVLYNNKVKVLSKRGRAKIVQMGRGDSSRSPRSNEGGDKQQKRQE